MIEHHHSVKRLIKRGLEEDLGPGDITTNAIIGTEATGSATLIAKEELILAGLPVFKKVFLEISSGIDFEDFFREGDLVSAKNVICIINGPLSAILKAERTALNILQRMCGIASLTHQYVRLISFSKSKILDTRKTVPGMRILDKYAVRTGGGLNHRFGLFDAVLIKENHISAAGSITNAIELARKYAPHTLKIEVEVEDLEGVAEALRAKPEIILLDNMSIDQITEAVRIVNGKAILEASGGVTLTSVAAIANTGVDYISVGELTHSVKASDLSLLVIPEKMPNR